MCRDKRWEKSWHFQEADNAFRGAVTQIVGGWGAGIAQKWGWGVMQGSDKTDPYKLLEYLEQERAYQVRGQD